MTVEDKRDAYAKLENALDDILKEYGYVDDDEIVAGWILVVNKVKFDEPESEDAPHQDVTSSFCYFNRDGQQPALTRGIVEEFLDYYRGIRKTEDD